MKTKGNTSGARLSVILAIMLSLALLTFLFIFPASYANRKMGELISDSEYCMNLCAAEKYTELRECILEMSTKLEKAAKVLDYFYAHKDVTDVQSSLAVAVSMVEHNCFDSSCMLNALSGIAENAQHIIDHERRLV